MILTAKWVMPISKEPLKYGAVVVEGEEIKDVGYKDEILSKYPQDEVKDLGEVILFPGLINIHTHLDYTILRGVGDNLSFLPWISKLVAKSRKLSFEEILLSAKLGALELLSAGVTTIADTTATGASLQAASELGLRGVIYQEVFGMDDEKIGLILADVEEKYNKLKSQANLKLKIGLSPHAPYSVSGRLLQEISKFAAKKDVPLCMHLAETEEEIEFLLEGTGSFATTYREAVGWGDIPWQAPQVSAVKYLDDLGVLNDRLLAVHVVQTNDEDLELLRENGVKVAHCPKSNAKLGNGIANLPAMLEQGLEVGLGTDSAASNNSLDLFSEMEFGLLLHRAKQRDAEVLTAKEVVEMATIKGARILGLEDEVGTLEIGKKADLTAVRIDNLANQPIYDPYSTLVYNASSRDVILTMIDGELIYKNEEFKGRTEEVLNEIKQVKQKIEE
ncbi:MAG: amidohydrolase [Candidatus Frackibacter sp. T328-2]|nr:MAG: amidohydrolase [Candidatus Frackibacter sp. T328-2]